MFSFGSTTAAPAPGDGFSWNQTATAAPANWFHGVAALEANSINSTNELPPMDLSPGAMQRCAAAAERLGYSSAGAGRLFGESVVTHHSSLHVSAKGDGYNCDDALEITVANTGHIPRSAHFPKGRIFEPAGGASVAGVQNLVLKDAVTITVAPGFHVTQAVFGYCGNEMFPPLWAGS
jgi:hypothetical protein